MFDNQNNAQNVLLGSGIQFFTGAVSNYDGVDYYKIQVNNRSDFNLSLSELKGDANVYLLDSTGQSLGSSNLTGSSSEAINTTLEAGTYFVKVDFAQETAVNANLPYQLAIANNPVFSNIDDKNPNGQKFYTGDFNGDGFQDVFRQERGNLVDGSKDAEVFIGNATGGYDAIQITNTELFQGNSNYLISGDFNGDGKTDIIRQEYGIDGNKVSKTQFTSFKDGKFQVVGDLQDMSAMRGGYTNLIAGDFNGDGRDDIIRQEKGSWVNGVRDVELYISDGKFKWSGQKVLPNASALIGNDTLLVAGDFIAGGGQDLIKIKTSNSAIDGVNDIQYLSYQNGNMALAGNSPTNIVSKTPQINGLNSSYDANSTLTLSNSYVFDNNGWKDISKVDFWLTNSQGQRLELNDVNLFTAKDANNAQFKYSTALSGVAVGDYQLNAVAYDKSGAGSSQFTKAFKVINNAPESLTIKGVKSSYDLNSTLSIDSGSITDKNGWQDVSKVDFWLTDSKNNRIELKDADSFAANGSDLKSAKFNYSTSLQGIAGGQYKLNALASDRGGATTKQFAQDVKIVNNAPQSLVINGVKSKYEENSTLSIDSGSITDKNGWQDVSKVDFWLTDSKNNRIELADVNSFTAKDQNSAQFNYSTNLKGMAVGNYKLHAIAYDQSGGVSNQFTQSLAIEAAVTKPAMTDANNSPDPIVPDWFGSNLQDAGTIDLVRTAANDGQLDRKDMLKILQGMEDGGVVDNSELADLKKLLQANEEKLFSISESVRYLSNKIAIESAANSTTEQFEGTIGKWLKGTVAPTAVFHQQGGKTYNLQYKEFTGSLFGASKEARIGGIDQLQFGDCVLFASLGATFAPQSSDAGNSSSKTINEMLIDNGDNTYAVRFYNTDQKAEWVTVDNRLATYNGAIFGANIKDGLWAPIIEKAYAQWFELKEGSSTKTGWDIIGNGDYYNVGLQRITGRTNQSYYKGEAGYDYSFTLIKDALAKGQAIIAGAANNPNLIADHAFSVTNAYIDSKGQERVVVRNPWGIDKDRSTAVTGENDGFIDLSYSDFRSFQEINIA